MESTTPTSLSLLTNNTATPDHHQNKDIVMPPMNYEPQWYTETDAMNLASRYHGRITVPDNRNTSSGTSGIPQEPSEEEEEPITRYHIHNPDNPSNESDEINHAALQDKLHKTIEASLLDATSSTESDGLIYSPNEIHPTNQTAAENSSENSHLNPTETPDLIFGAGPNDRHPSYHLPAAEYDYIPPTSLSSALRIQRKRERRKCLAILRKLCLLSFLAAIQIVATIFLVLFKKVKGMHGWEWGLGAYLAVSIVCLGAGAGVAGVDAEGEAFEEERWEGEEERRREVEVRRKEERRRKEGEV
jgi:hypothetical protein